MNKIISRSLDLGCGMNPKNPFDAEELFGVDINKNIISLGVNFKNANLSTNQIPFEDNYFDYVSAFDFIEHIPRCALGSDQQQTFPFIDLMNEIYRVLKHEGCFYAMTPCYPAVDVFSDPTHVNFITTKTGDYFLGKNPYSSIYGFNGYFEPLEYRWVNNSVGCKSSRNIQSELKIFFRTYIKRNQTHFLWKFKAIKNENL
jgi:SAM-dependent methyltransferase